MSAHHHLSFLSLPNELVEMIFKELNDLSELVVCRLINKRCRDVVNGIRLNRLVVKDVHLESSFDEKRRYEFTGDLIGSTSVIVRVKGGDLLNFKFKQMLFRLKKLALVLVSIETDTAFQQFETQINKLQALEHLQILMLIADGGAKTLVLNHIRTFAIDACYGQIVLLAPELTKLATLCDPQRFRIFDNGYVNQLTHLTLPGAGAEDLATCSVQKLEYLRFKGNPENLNSIRTIIFTCPELRELHMEMVNKAAVCEILKQKKISRNLNLVIYFSGLPISRRNHVDQLFGEQTELQTVGLPYVVKNFERLRSVDLVLRVNYSQLIDYQDRLSVDSFLSKFTRIEQLEVGKKVGNETIFTEFLEKCKSLKQIIINRSPMVQVIYDDLPYFCANLEILDIKMPSEQVIDLRFLLRFPRLRTLTVNRRFDPALLHQLLRASECLFTLKFPVLIDRWVCLTRAHDGWNHRWSTTEP